ncbi:Gfo/Idh/MocA family protein [Streptomyces zingiberis]|uniref:Inositol 2-dehydrogenase n=1 Tax=Streptomyces zingiberis TaxID=2053010 RepID=A0ABX1C365_9ACTN|nr:Gfo/Idh/MocA family oxidoreductase [Streptomyces zingiberis]NJQ02575.1 Gfo/Idh/MocA family oxidoreductase [Streptomyces zingiberis]
MTDQAPLVLPAATADTPAGSPATTPASPAAAAPLTDVLGVAVIGAGRMGADHVRRLHRTIRGARVAAVADVDAERAKRLADTVPGCAAHSDPEAALSSAGVDAVLIASPGPVHEEQILAALERGLPVLCEKPLTPDTASALRVLRAESALGRRRVQVGFMRRYDAEFRRLKRLLDEGELGRPRLLHCRHRNVTPAPGFTEAMMITDSVAHEVDTVRWLLRQEITAVTVLRPGTGGVDEPQLVLFETDGGAVVDVEIFVNCGFGYQVQCEAVCATGSARIGDGHAMVTHSAGRWGGEIVQDWSARFEDAYDREVREWVEAARRDEVTGPDVWDGYAAAAVCEAGVRAQATGERVPVPLIGRPELYG